MEDSEDLIEEQFGAVFAFSSDVQEAINEVCYTLI